MTITDVSPTIFRMGTCKSINADEADIIQVKVLDIRLFETERSKCVKVEIIQSNTTQEYNGKETLFPLQWKGAANPTIW